MIHAKRTLAFLAGTLVTVLGCRTFNPRNKDLPLAGGPPESSSQFQVPVPESFQLSNGLPVWLLRTKEVPLVTLSLLIRSGSTSDPPGKEGLAALAASMLDEGAGARGALELADEIDFLGADLAIDAEKEYTQVSLEVLQRNLDPALDILADVVMRPSLLEVEWERVKTLWLNDLAQRREDPREVARVVTERAFYGDKNPYAHPTDGYEAAVKAVELSDVKAFYREHVRPENAILVAVGDASPDDLRARLDQRFSAWKGHGAPPRPAGLEAPPRPEPRLVIVDKPGAPQTVVRIVVPGPEFSSPRMAPLSLVNIVFGGSFTSRLISNLREKNKFTYGAFSSFSLRKVPGHVVAGSSVYSEKTGPALVEFCREFHAMETGKVEPDEIDKARSTHRSHLFEALETQHGTLRVYGVSAALGSSPSERHEFYQRAQALKPEEMSQEARRTIRWEEASIILVGDRQLLESQLRELKAHPPGDLAGKPFKLPAVEIRGRDGEKGG